MDNLLRCYRIRAWSCTSQYTPCAFILSALHLDHSDTPSSPGNAGDSGWQGKISLEGYTPAKMAAEPQRHSRAPTRHYFPPTRHSYAPIRYLPPEGRHVYRPRDGKFTARGAVSNEFTGKSDED